MDGTTFNRVCQTCNTPFNVPKWRADNPYYGKFCSRDCRNKSLERKIDVTCVSCGRVVKKRPSICAQNPYCSRECYAGVAIKKRMGDGIYDGMVLCISCGDYKFPDQFPIDKLCPIGVKSTCRMCVNEHRKERLSNDPAYAERARITWRMNTHKRRARKAQTTTDDITPNDIMRMLDAQHHKCYWCDIEIVRQYHIDHIIPLSRKGTHTLNNLCISCVSCNLSKNNKLPIEFIGENINV
jgi:5-methylcytosine-specific restriction endonuclease McrA